MYIYKHLKKKNGKFINYKIIIFFSRYVYDIQQSVITIIRQRIRGGFFIFTENNIIYINILCAICT